MTVSISRKVVYAAMSVVLLTGSLMASSPKSPPDTVAVQATAWNFQKEASDLLEETRRDSPLPRSSYSEL